MGARFGKEEEEEEEAEEEQQPPAAATNATAMMMVRGLVSDELACATSAAASGMS